MHREQREFLFMHKFVAVIDAEAELPTVTCISFHFLKFCAGRADLRRR
jgi:hypothetical protein